MSLVNEGLAYYITESREVESLPVGYYTIAYQPDLQVFLKKREPFKLPSKIYGEKDFSQLIIDSYNTSDKSIGVLFNGLKGTGKTLTAKSICDQINKPVIVLDDYTIVYSKFREFLQFINEAELNDTVFLADEFEKSPFKDKTELLSWFDGTGLNKHLFLLITNSTNRLNDLFFNRLGRIAFQKEFRGLSPEVVEEIVDDLYLKDDKDHLLQFLKKVPLKTFDNITKIISLANKLEQPIDYWFDYLNLKSINQSFAIYSEDWSEYYTSVTLTIESNRVYKAGGYTINFFIGHSQAVLDLSTARVIEQDSLDYLIEVEVSIIHPEKDSEGVKKVREEIKIEKYWLSGE